MDCFITGDWRFSSWKFNSSVDLPNHCNSVILSVTLVLTVMIVASPPGTKNIAAQWVNNIFESIAHLDFFFSFIGRNNCKLLFIFSLCSHLNHRPKNNGAEYQPERPNLLTFLFVKVAMMSRITLNLKKAGVQFKSDVHEAVPSTILFDRRRKRSSASHNLLDGTFAISILPSPLPFIDQSTEHHRPIISREDRVYPSTAQA